MKKRLLFFVMLFVGTLSLSAQDMQVSGKITYADDGYPVIGATILVKGTSTGAFTDSEGNYAVTIPASAEHKTLIVSYAGLITVEEHVAVGQDVINFVLQTDALSIDEVIVVGYGTQRKQSLTGAMTNIKADRLNDITTPSVENMLNGKVAGVYVTPGTGRPGEAGNVVIRGKTSINGSNAPLWVIDGVIVGSSAGSLNPDDVASMTVLKDAASTAIYGSQGSNGVIIITTKGAKVGETTINVSAKAGVTLLNKGNMDVMSGTQLYDYYSSFSNPEAIVFDRWNPDLRNSNFDWYDLAATTGFTQDYNVSISSGTEKVRTYFSAGYYDETGAVEGYEYSRFNARFKTDYTPFEWLTIKPSAYGSITDTQDAQRSVGAMYSMLPWDSPYDADGNLVGHRSPLWVNSNSTNYMYDLQWNNSSTNRTEISANFDFDVRFTDYLTFVSVNNFRQTQYSTASYQDPRSNAGMGVQGRITETGLKQDRLYTNQMLRFAKSWGKHSVNALAGYEFNSYKGESTKAIGTGFVPGYDVFDITAIPELVDGSRSEWAVQSIMFKGNYNYDNRLFFEGSFRRDGASNFGTNAKYGNFFSVSGGWAMDREKWFKADWIDQLKLRGSYGSTGNRPGELYPQYDLYGIGMGASYDGIPGALISQVGNKDMTWETTYTLDFGIDFAAFESRLRLSFDWYNKATSGLLYAVPVSGLTGVTSLWQNVGEVNNTGVELSIGGDLIRTKDWTWSLDFNAGHNKNKVESIYSGQDEMIVDDGSLIAGSAQKMIKPGLDADTWYLREWAGVNVQTGAAEWYKTVKHADGTTTREKTSSYAEADEVVLDKKFTPDFYGGFSTHLQWKNISLGAVFGFSIGGDIYNYSRLEYDSDGAYTDRNQMNLRPDWNRWEKPGDIATHPIASYNNASNSSKSSSRFLEDGSYLKLRSLTLAYSIALPKAHIKNLRVSLSGQNLFTITNYSGVDPEIPVTDGKITGVNITPYPSATKFMLGVNFTF